jgi:hypothetical protein
MTDTQFETLRQELRGLRSDFDERFAATDRRFHALDLRLTKLELRLAEKPDRVDYIQPLFTVGASFIAVIGLALPVFRSVLVPA